MNVIKTKTPVYRHFTVAQLRIWRVRNPFYARKYGIGRHIPLLRRGRHGFSLDL
jgi:hypothetical protein